MEFILHTCFTCILLLTWTNSDITDLRNQYTTEFFHVSGLFREKTNVRPDSPGFGSGLPTNKEQHP